VITGYFSFLPTFPAFMTGPDHHMQLSPVTRKCFDVDRTVPVFHSRVAATLPLSATIRVMSWDAVSLPITRFRYFLRVGIGISVVCLVVSLLLLSPFGSTCFRL